MTSAIQDPPIHNSALDICNMSLGILGVSPITSFTDEVSQATQCKFLYGMVRDGVLEDRAWRFATKRTILSPIAKDNPAYGWDYVYEVPAATIRVFHAYHSPMDDDAQTEWQLEGQRIMANDNPLYIKYVYRVTDVKRFSAGFISALVVRLAAELSVTLKGNRNLRKDLMSEYELRLSRAGTREGQQGRSRVDPKPPSTYLVR